MAGWSIRRHEKVVRHHGPGPSPFLAIAASLIGGYLLGSIPFGLIATRLGGAGDIRKVGSGNIGATNVLRTGRRDLALITLLGDGGKGAAAALIAGALFSPLYAAVAGGAAFVGHIFPVWLRFRGGKGVATFYGVLFAIAWPVGLAAGATWVAIALVFRISSLAALTSALLTPAWFILLRQASPERLLLAVGMAVLIFIRHEANIRRLLKGEEPRDRRLEGPGLTAPALTAAQRLDWLRLARTESVGPVTFAHLIDRFGVPRRGPGRPSRSGPSRRTRPCATRAQRPGGARGAGRRRGARRTVAAGPRRRLSPAAGGPRSPAAGAMDTRRCTSLLARPMVAIVGARIASAAGRRFARDLAEALGASGWVVVSGMARGIDSAAHQGALAHGTVAVLAGGVDDVYPPENADLHRDLGARGCIVSERQIGAGAKAADFPRRNRIISGLSRGVIVVEAELRSGSLITARLAGEQGREVFAVPGSPLDPRSRGANDLLQPGRHPGRGG